MSKRRVPAHSIARSREPLKPMKPSSAARRRDPPLQRWLTFLRNHAPNIADMDLFVVPTIGLDLLWARKRPYGINFLVFDHALCEDFNLGAKRSSRTPKSPFSTFLLPSRDDDRRWPRAHGS